MNLKTLLSTQPDQLALVIGNGINRYNSDAGLNSWDAMLLELWQRHTKEDAQIIPLGISLTEFYDALDLSSQLKEKNLQKEFCDFLTGWTAKEHHQRIVNWAKHNKTPILTTNFDETLSNCLALNLHHADGQRFTDFYPWGSCFSESEIRNPAREFGIWHINGIQRYSRSIRLGLSHYMGSVERARALIHKGEQRLYTDDTVTRWNGEQTWLHCIFNNNLVFLGLGLDTSEIFLRWLLIERAKYFKHFPKRTKKAYYVYAGRDISQGQMIFLKSVGCEVVKESSYDNLYGDVWR
ncbi:hypothetical protein [Cellvibrio sp. OA-2007]|uniref:hypothetical protein n=1 Tax=Cellvibrio sp. OA-2007 TaxID=529823 RepID=UPI00078240AA|nr:hypothetical protein [Cellvibrio sp. OA-2007]